MRYDRNQLHVSIPLSALHLGRDASRLAFEFKWIDNAQHMGDIMDFDVNGDVAPEARFRFRYVAERGLRAPLKCLPSPPAATKSSPH
jgi:hypothetical protein